MSLYDLIINKRTEIIEIATLHGAENVRLFGSVARLEDDDKSDIDFLIDLPSDLSRLSPWFPVLLIRDLENLLHRKVDVAIASDLNPRIKDRVLQKAISI
ncbi:nucleotidyltransferase domain-containing protein [Pleurocapsales cyanobacterium LEGE 06147]|nr:nucleotidyltransferase domain-containing protein [Pleurocapsales cyanobacterium LEGE 06147]